MVKGMILMNDNFFDWLPSDIDGGDIDSICLNCKLEEKIPDFIYGEFSEKVKHKELKTNQAVSTIYCNRCHKLKTVSKYWINHE